MVRFLLVPLWQGSSSSRAMDLAAGVEAIGTDLPQRSTGQVDVPPGAGSALETGVARASTVISVRDSVRVALAQRTEPVLTIGGGTTSALGGIEQVWARHERPLLLIFSPRPGLRAPTGNVSADEALVPLLSGQGHPLLAPQTPLEPEQIMLVGARDRDPAQPVNAGITLVPDVVSLPEALRSVVTSSGITDIYILIDLPIIDPTELSTGDLVPFGLTTAELTQAIGDASAIRPVRGAALTGFAPGNDNDVTNSMSTILRVIGALSRGLDHS